MTLRKAITKAEFSKSVKLASSNPANGVKFKPTSAKYVMIKGIPHKMVNKQLVPLTKLVK
jgi:hypothetical protein